jgi:putative transposase
MPPEEPPGSPTKEKNPRFVGVVKRLRPGPRPLIHFLNGRYRQWTKPDTESLVTGMLIDATRSKRGLIAENAFLRQQLIVFKRQTPRPPLTSKDRGLLVLLASWVHGWQNALLVLKPDTLKKWHREGFHLYWRRRSIGISRRPRISPEAIALIQQMAIENRLWSARCIRDELRKLGHWVSKRTVRKYMKQARRDWPPRRTGQTRLTFLKNHASEIWACDFVQTYDVFFRTISVFFIIELGSRRVVHFGATRSPRDAWVAQQWRNATPFNEGPRFLIRDNDDKFGPAFSQVTGNIDVLKTPERAPKADAFCEECADRCLRRVGSWIAKGHRLVEIGAIQHVVAAHLLVRLREAAIGGQRLAVAHADGYRAGSRRQAIGIDQHPGVLRFLVVVQPRGLDFLLFFRRILRRFRLVPVHQQQVFHELVLLWNEAAISGSQSNRSGCAPEVGQAHFATMFLPIGCSSREGLPLNYLSTRLGFGRSNFSYAPFPRGQTH